MLPDLLQPGLALVFCGTAASRRSAARGHYYAGPGNRFWALLAETGITPRRLAPEEDATLPELGIGLTDLAKTAAGMDKDIPASAYAPDRFFEKLRLCAPDRLAFTSLTAARLALGQRHAPGRSTSDIFPGLPIWVLPSPSGAARASFSAAPWHDLAAHLRGAR